MHLLVSEPHYEVIVFHHLYFIYFKAHYTRILDFLIFQSEDKGACYTQVNTEIF
jgi:hypothetical protein